MQTRITFDLKDPKLIKMLKYESTLSGKPIRKLLEEAVRSHFSELLETRSLMMAAESVFSEWDNELDADYDKLR